MPVAVEDRGGAVALMLASLFLLGTWPVLLTLLERRGRLPQHTYLDYSITNLLAAVLMAVAFGQAGDSRPDFFTQLTQVSVLDPLGFSEIANLSLTGMPSLSVVN